MNKKDRLYFWLLGLVIAASFAVMVVRLADLQVRGADDYGDIAERTMTKTIYERGSRGQILDANGALLAYDKKTYNIQFYRSPMSDQEQNGEYSKAIWEVIKLVEREGKEVKFDFWLAQDEAGEWYFNTNTEDEGVAAARERMFRSNFYVTNTDTQAIYERLCDNYLIHQIDTEFPEAQKLTLEDKLKVLSVWQEMQMNAFNSTPIVLAKDVRWSTVMEVETRLVSLPGISVSVQNQRVYPKGSLASHVLGYTGLMQTESQIAEYLEKGYLRSDSIGLDGVEKTMEQWLTPNSSLRRGYTVAEVDRQGRRIRELEKVTPSDGNSVKLTIDSALQSVVETALANVINEIRDVEEAKLSDGTWLEANKEELQKREANARDIRFAENGAVVVLDMECRVLAMASYPNYDPNIFISGDSELRAQVLGDTRNRLFNNAIQAADTPGSVFKMCTALAALAGGVVTTTEEISDEGPYTAYDKTNPPRCWVAPRLIGNHSNQQLHQGLLHSCNYYFYTLADRMFQEEGDLLHDFASKLGLTTKTNIDLPGERRSVVGSQVSLYDPTKPITEYDQDTAIPFLVKEALKKHLIGIGDMYGITYSDDRLEKCIKALMDMAIANAQGDDLQNWMRLIRPILMEELGMTMEMVWRSVVVSQIGHLLNQIKWGGTYAIMTGIGQSITLTSPIAMARYVAAVANGGYVYDVQLIDSIISPSGDTIVSFDEPALIHDLSDEIGQYIPVIHEGMKGVVDDEGGTAKARFAKWPHRNNIAAKTGTAETSYLDIENNAWMVAFAPFEEPEIVVVVYVPFGLGGSQASQAIMDVIGFYLESNVDDTALILPAPNALAQ